MREKHTLNSKAVFLWLYLPATFLFLITISVAYYKNYTISYFTRDPIALTGGHPLLGFISNIGIIFWCFSLAICIFSYVFLKKSKKGHDVIGFIMFGGIISLLLLVDDFFMLHEKIYYNYLGINEFVVFVFYAILILFYLVKFRRIILDTDYIFILLSLFFFAFTLTFDALQMFYEEHLLPKTVEIFYYEYLLNWHYVYEDGSKFFGIVSWFAYQFSTCFTQVQSIAYAHAPDKSID